MTLLTLQIVVGRRHSPSHLGYHVLTAPARRDDPAMPRSAPGCSMKHA
jgi:hypothetical protein